MTAQVLRAGRFTLAVGGDDPLAQPLLMAILNVGSDSVADELRLHDLQSQLKRAGTLMRQGAAIVDIGVQSGRTDTEEMPASQEIEMLTPLVSELAEAGAIVSVDTYRASVAEAAVKAGASIVNDVGGLQDPEIADVAAAHSAGLVLMHTRAAPKQVSFPGYEDPVSDVLQRLERLMEISLDAGVSEEQVILDPGLDYAKTPNESIEVLRRLRELHVLQRPILLAVSRKYFLGMITNRPPMQRLSSTLAALSFGVEAGASILRVHDVSEASDFLAVRRALLADGPIELLGDPETETLKWLPAKEPILAPATSAPDTPLTTYASAAPSHTSAAPDTPLTTDASSAAPHVGGLPDTPHTTIEAAPAVGGRKEAQT